jgi:hypothetical protein
MRDPALPPAAHRREPAFPASTGVLDPGGVDVGARREQRAEERHLRVIGRVFMDRSRRRIEETGLRRTRRLGVPRAQLQHLQQARVLRPQPRQLRGHSRGNLSHAHTIFNPRPCSSCRRAKRQPGRARRSFRRRLANVSARRLARRSKSMCLSLSDHRPGGHQRNEQQPVRDLPNETFVLRAIRPGMDSGQPGA